MGKSLPRGSFVLVPFCGKAAAGEALYYSNDVKQFTSDLESALINLAKQM
jgi:hypothetical protein